MTIKMLFDGSIAAGIDGNQWFLSNGLCLGDPTAKFIFADTLGDCRREWNKKYESHGELRLDEYEHFFQLNSQEFLNDDSIGVWK